VSPVTELRTARLVLRPHTLADAPAVQRYASDIDVSRNTLTIPHPYPEGAAATWIESVHKKVADGVAAVFAICEHGRDELIGTIGLQIEREQRRAELGYWMGKPFRGKGLTSEAARAVLEHGFGELGLERIFAGHFHWNPASGRVLEKAGMLREGLLRGHVLKNGERVDLHYWGMLREDLARSNAPRARGDAQRA
jgi:ribosomal-protein-alanine N-acetyltransferase